MGGATNGVRIDVHVEVVDAHRRDHVHHVVVVALLGEHVAVQWVDGCGDGPVSVSLDGLEKDGRFGVGED